MPRTARASAGNVCYHVLNRGNAQNDIASNVGHAPHDRNRLAVSVGADSRQPSQF